MSEEDKKQLKTIFDLLGQLVIECDHGNFSDSIFPFKEIQDLEKFLWEKYFWLEKMLK